MPSQSSLGINYLDNQIKKLRSIFKNGLDVLTLKVKILKEFIKLGSKLSELFIKIYMNSWRVEFQKFLHGKALTKIQLLSSMVLLEEMFQLLLLQLNLLLPLSQWKLLRRPQQKLNQQINHAVRFKEEWLLNSVITRKRTVILLSMKMMPNQEWVSTFTIVKTLR